MKLVAESLQSYMRFTEDGDAIKDMGIGLDELIHKWMHDHGIAKHKYRLTKKKTIVGDDTIILSNMHIGEFPEFINFAHINGGFHCDNSDITSLRGCPRLVQGSFFCSKNPLKSSSLVGGPQQVIGTYAASNCGLESLEGIAFKIEEALYIDSNSLHSLEFIPKEVGDLYMTGNQIQSLKHFPTNIYGDLHITRSKILNELTVSKICSVSGEIFEY
jgi:hypothetical protein